MSAVIRPFLAGNGSLDGQRRLVSIRPRESLRNRSPSFNECLDECHPRPVNDYANTASPAFYPLAGLFAVSPSASHHSANT